MGALFAELVRSLGLFEPLSCEWLKLAQLAGLLPVEFAVVAWALAATLARGRRVLGRWLTVPGRRRTVRSGHIGDYVTWIVLGVALGGGVFALMSFSRSGPAMPTYRLCVPVTAHAGRPRIRGRSKARAASRRSWC